MWDYDLSDADVSGLQDIDDYGSACAVASIMLADGYELEDVADALRFDYGLTVPQAWALAYLMQDEPR